MEFSEYLFKEAKPIWDEYLNHPFIKELGEGTLPKEKFKSYLIQDYLYLKEYSKVFCIGVVKATTMDEMKFFYNSIKGAMEDETESHIMYLKGFGVNPSKAEFMEKELVTLNYTNYMQAVGLKGDLIETAIATLPCTWSYSYVGKYVAEKYKDKLEDNFYKEWVDTYNSEGYDKFTEEWIDYTNKICKDISEEKKKKLLDIFLKCSIYEKQFWDMAYKEVK